MRARSFATGEILGKGPGKIQYRGAVRQIGLGILRTLMDEQARVERQLRTEPNRKASA